MTLSEFFNLSEEERKPIMLEVLKRATEAQQKKLLDAENINQDKEDIDD